MKPFTTVEYNRQPKEGIKRLRSYFEAIFIDFQDINGDIPTKPTKPMISDFNTENNPSTHDTKSTESEQKVLENPSSSLLEPSGLFSSKFTKNTWASYDKRCKALDGMRRTREFEKGLLVPGAAEQTEYSNLLSEFEVLEREWAWVKSLIGLVQWGNDAFEGRLCYERLVERASGPAV